MATGRARASLLVGEARSITLLKQILHASRSSATVSITMTNRQQKHTTTMGRRHQRQRTMQYCR